ncbi:DUF4913 domain-containing protein (plasmid) [Nocardia sp. NBC_01377]|uniref:DUF4913 domain-containing protein n=1 Tax=Nocardia sp. NBC_01377 TaxID=2903595 RepID=UPI002F90D12C
MNAPASAPQQGTEAPKYADFVTFAENWLLPVVTVRLAENRRENTFTWCTQWWRHRAVTVRVAHLHRAFEAARIRKDGAAVNSYLLHHVDAHFRRILDAANGPLHACTRAQHVALASLPFDPVPLGWFGPEISRTKPRATEAENADTPPPPPMRFPVFFDFVEQWLLPVISVRLVGKNREQTYTWCRQWWRHRGVAMRFAALHTVFEASRLSEDGLAMSSLFTSHIDPQMQHILDAANGPLHRCTTETHVELNGLPHAVIPPAWFGLPDTETPVEDLGFGPDFRAMNPRLRRT